MKDCSNPLPQDADEFKMASKITGPTSLTNGHNQLVFSKPRQDCMRTRGAYQQRIIWPMIRCFQALDIKYQIWCCHFLNIPGETDDESITIPVFASPNTDKEPELGESCESPIPIRGGHHPMLSSI